MDDEILFEVYRSIKDEQYNSETLKKKKKSHTSKWTEKAQEKRKRSSWMSITALLGPSCDLCASVPLGEKGKILVSISISYSESWINKWI